MIVIAMCKRTSARRYLSARGWSAHCADLQLVTG
jgi:hypothetical protein